MSSKFTVAIVGCGIGGLCLAQGLRRKGINFHLFERDPSRVTRNQGYRITVDENGLKALEACLSEDLFPKQKHNRGRWLRGWSDLRVFTGCDGLQRLEFTRDHFEKSLAEFAA